MPVHSTHPVIRVALPVPLRQVFDYLPIQAAPVPIIGGRVVVPFGRRKLVGVVVGHAQQSKLPADKLLPVIDSPDGAEAVLTAESLALLKWCWHYYKHAPGDVVFSALPPLLRKTNGVLPPPTVQYSLTDTGRQRLQQPIGRVRAQMRFLQYLSSGAATREQLRRFSPGWRKTLSLVEHQGWVQSTPAEPPAIQLMAGPDLNEEQHRAVVAIKASLAGFHCHLLDGVTGSGKTEVYLRAIEKVLENGGQALLLVPEIGLTPQLLGRFTERFGFKPLVTHSGLSEGQRLKAWAEAKSGLARLVIGTRSALFLPMPDLQLIILDEEHDASFKQQDGFRYSSRDVAVKRASRLKIPVVLGTATPSMETFNNASSGRYHWNRLRLRATGASEPRWRVLDLRQQHMSGGLAASAMTAIGKTLEKGEQALIFLNRRGYAPVMLCHQCGWHASCHRCDANLTWHKARHRLLCHHCDSGESVPVMCPQCGADALQGAGEGTEQLEQFLAHSFPKTPLLRFDRDTVRKKNEFHRLSEQVKRGESCLLVGTQMIAKGHHFPQVTLVVIVNLDQALYSTDFRALERMGQLMVQVAGRAGRDKLPGEVILQTHYPQHESLQLLLSSGYEAFARGINRDRQMACLPPFSFQALLRAQAHQKQDVKTFLHEAGRCFPAGRAIVYGPFPAMMERRGGLVRWYLLVQANDRPGLHKQLDEWLASIHKLPAARRVRWAVDVDPQNY